jgi:hypothetical protein
VLPEHSTNVGDLIQPVPGVLYEDSKLKKGDTRRYKVYHERFFFSLFFHIGTISNRMECQNIQIFMMKVVH